MSFIQFESAREKEIIREDLRKAREELLRRAQQNAEKRAEKEARKSLTGETTWMLPDLEKKVEKMSKARKKSAKSSKKHTKEKKQKKEKKKSKKRKSKRKQSSSESDSSDTEEEISKKKKRKRKMSTESSSSSSSSSSEADREGEWVEKVEKKAPALRDDWMVSPMLLKTFSKNDKPVKEKQHIESYDPAKSVRELNPHWKNGGGGLPTFKKPSEDDVDSRKYHNDRFSNHTATKGGWKKRQETTIGSLKSRTPSPSSPSKCGWKKRQEATIVSENRRSPSRSSSSSEEDKDKGDEKPSLSTSNFLTDQQMNELGAKIVKAEIMGNNELADELKVKLEKAREVPDQARNTKKQDILKGKQSKGRDSSKDEHILLTVTDSKGSARPLLHQRESESDRYGGRQGKKKKQKAETHISGERVRYFPDDDKYDIKQMFEREKYISAADSDAQFAEIAGKHKNPKDDLEDIFADKVRKSMGDYDIADKEKQRAIWEHERLTRKLDTCDKCFDSEKMEKHLLVSMGTKVYLALPWHEGLQPNHCLIVPMQHASCSTQLDEDTWEEISDYRKALTKMFAEHKQDVVFFETARYLHKRPHMVIHCVPASSMEMAPFYFKKAIQESEYEWSTNKQLVSLKDKSLRRAIPKGLPYFWVNFGMDSGFAHVIEDQERFPSNFAQEIIGGMLHLDASKWRRPRKEQNAIPKVKNLADWWKPYDFTE